MVAQFVSLENPPDPLSADHLSSDDVVARSPSRAVNANIPLTLHVVVCGMEYINRLLHRATTTSRTASTSPTPTVYCVVHLRGRRFLSNIPRAALGRSRSPVESRDLISKVVCGGESLDGPTGNFLRGVRLIRDSLILSRV